MLVKMKTAKTVTVTLGESVPELASSTFLNFLLQEQKADFFHYFLLGKKKIFYLLAQMNATILRQHYQHCFTFICLVSVVLIFTWDSWPWEPH